MRLTNLTDGVRSIASIRATVERGILRRRANCAVVMFFSRISSLIRSVIPYTRYIGISPFLRSKSDLIRSFPFSARKAFPSATRISFTSPYCRPDPATHFFPLMCEPVFPNDAHAIFGAFRAYRAWTCFRRAGAPRLVEPRFDVYPVSFYYPVYAAPAHPCPRRDLFDALFSYHRPYKFHGLFRILPVHSIRPPSTAVHRAK